MNKDRKWWISRDEELFNVGPFNTREEAIKEAPFELELEEDEKSFYIASSVPLKFHCPLDADDYIDRLLEYNEEVCGEWNETWQEDIEKDKELKKEIEEKILEIDKMILKKHPQIMMEGKTEEIKR